MAKKILMVCLGNICRSPLAQGIMEQKVAKYQLDVMVDSAGTTYHHIGENPDKRSIANALKHNIDISQQKARLFSAEDFVNFDLIYVMDLANYKNVIGLAQSNEDKKKVTLIMNELYPRNDIEVPDPYFGGEEGFEKVYNLLDLACECIARKLSAS